MAGLAGKNMRLSSGNATTNLRITDGSIVARTQLVDITNSESMGFEEFVFGVAGGDLDATVVYTYTSPAVYTIIQNGGTYTTTFYPDKGVAGSNFAGLLMVESFNITGQVKGDITAKITGKFTVTSVNGVVTGGGVTATNV